MSTEHSTIPTVTATRTGSWTYTVDNGRGATLEIGLEGANGAFSPIELLQAALAGCAALSAEAQLVNKLGDAAAVVSSVDAAHDSDTNRIPTFTNRITANMSSLDTGRRDKLIAAAERSIGALCMVKNSLTHGAEATTTVLNDSELNPEAARL